MTMLTCSILSVTSAIGTTSIATFCDGGMIQGRSNSRRKRVQKMASLIFRGMSLRGGDWKNTKKGAAHRYVFKGDLTDVAACGLGVEDHFYEDVADEETGKEYRKLRDFDEKFQVSGTMRLEKCTITPNGFRDSRTGITATDLDWQIETKKGKKPEDPSQARLKLMISTPDPFGIIESYCKAVSIGIATLHVKLAEPEKQMKLGQTVPDEPADEPESTDGGPALASAREVEGLKKRRPATTVPDAELATTE